MASMTESVPLVRFAGLGRQFAEGSRIHHVLRGASGALWPGEVTALLGPSGSGKSTLLNLLSGIDLPDGGTVEIAGEVINQLPDKQRTLFRRRHIGFVYQFFNLIPTLSLGENVLLPLELNQCDRRRQRASEALTAVGLAERWTDYPDQLSGGEQQRVAIARALVHQPVLLLADEPTGNLDKETGSRCFTLLCRLVRGQQATMLVATHSREISVGCDRILRIRDGRVVEDQW
jgi:putative ABC transport system ATP-binding protein